MTPQNSLKTYLLQGGTATIDLPSGSTNDVTVRWDTDAALLIAIYSDDGSTAKVEYVGVNPFNASRVAGFITSSETAGKSNYSFPSPTDMKMIRVKSLLAATNLEVSGSFNDPQYHTVRSEATGPDGVTRTIEVAKTIEVPPAILDYAVYSGGSITKN